MEFNIRNVPYKADRWEITTEIARQVLHLCPGLFVTGPQERLPNFKVELNKSEAGGVQNNGTGTLTLTKSLGRKFQRLSDQISIEVREKKLRFVPSKKPVGPGLVQELEKAPFINPDTEKDREWRINTLYDPFLTTRVQIGVFYHPRDVRPQDPRAFSVEWEKDLSQRSMGLLFFNYKHKALRIQIGDQSQEETFYNIIVRFSSIKKMAIGHDFGNPYVCFDLFTPPTILTEPIYGPHTGESKSRRFRHRVESLDPGHEIVAPYAHHLRIVLHDSGDFGFTDILPKFEYYCETACLAKPRRVTIDANGRQKLFSSRKLHEIAIWLRSPILSSNWRVAFQVEALIHNGVANTVELMELRPHIEKLIHSFGSAAGDVMRRFVESAARRPLGQRVFECFENARMKGTRRLRLSPSRGRFFCHHATFTPTRLLLEGPTIIQSNRVIREYEGYEDHFIRVSFLDEGHIRYKWDREVDGPHFLQSHVGTLLKEGFDLAGRHFEFLGYSSSALKEHSVWYLNAFHHRTKGLVTAQGIRDLLGDFSGVIQSPSKYGARMAQAFSATDPSVRIRRDQWTIIQDITEGNINFTDGIGTISPRLAEWIWETLCADNPSLANNSVVPTAYQIRFLGCKGVVSVDLRLEGNHMCVRPSMNKFDVPGEEYGTIEICEAFSRPHIPYLNRPVVTLLEDRGTPKDVFLQLQAVVVADTRMAHDSAALYAKLLESNHLCFNYRLAAILKRLNALGLDLRPDSLLQPLDTPFLARLRACAINHVLRAVKYEARIQIPNSYMLAGVADEGPAYVKDGCKDVYCLPQGKIFACVQTPDDKEPRHLKGMCLIYRNPVIHPGDVQRVYAIGPPPEGQECLFGHLKNVVVFPATGTWSLPNGLGGGDLDGDLYTVIQHGDLLVTEHHDPASYLQVNPFKLDRPSTIEDVCDFIVEYINSDVVGLVADKHITIADQSKVCALYSAFSAGLSIWLIKFGSLDPDCLKLAEMHSCAVDYPKNGNRVDIKDLPRSLISFKPDWKKEDEDISGPSDYYESDRALGHLYRKIKLDDVPNDVLRHKGSPESHPISRVLLQHLRRHLPGSSDQTPTWIESLYISYCEELIYISTTFSLFKGPGSRLSEEELVIGTILGSGEKQRRRPRQYAMRDSMGFLVNDVKEQLVGRLDGLSETALGEKLAIAWSVWKFSLEKTRLSPIEFGSESFGLIGLGLVLECLERLGGLPPL